MPDHVHILLKTSPDISISQLVKDIKVNSTKWFKDNRFNLPLFSWLEGYGAFTVSKLNVDSVKKYIMNQKEHHKNISFENELLYILDKHELNYDPKYVLG